MLLFFLITKTVGLFPPIGTLILVAIFLLKSPLLSDDVNEYISVSAFILPTPILCFCFLRIKSELFLPI